MNLESLTPFPILRLNQSHRTHSQAHQFSSLLNGTIRCFQHADDSKAGVAVVDWRLVVEDTIREVSEFDTQRLRLFDLRRPHVAGSVAYEDVADSFSPADRNTLVVHTYLFVGHQIVPDQHLFLASDQGGANLHG